MSKISFAIVGCGHIGKRHIEVVLNEPKARLTDICDVEYHLAQELAEGVTSVSAYKEFDNMLTHSDADIISICTPHGLHAPMSIKAARAGKHILVEKPMALTSSESQLMIEAAREENVRLFVVKQNRYNKPIALAKKAITKNKLGKILWSSAMSCGTGIAATMNNQTGEVKETWKAECCIPK